MDFGFGHVNAWSRSQLGIYGNIIGMVPTIWALQIAHPAPTNVTDLGVGNEIVDLDRLWDNIVAGGMRDPVLIAVSLKTGRGRLEAGNHRVRVAAAKNIPFLPATVLVGNEEIIHPGNGTHCFDFSGDLIEEVDPARSFPDRLMEPKAVFKSIAAMAGEIPDARRYLLPV